MKAATVPALALAVFATIALPGEANAQEKVRITLEFMDHLEAGMIEQDVFVRKDANISGVFRITSADGNRYMSRPVFATANATAHAPMDMDMVGPFEAGPELGFSLNQWLAAAGMGNYTCENGGGNITVTFINLVPNGLYTMWHAFSPNPPASEMLTLQVPVGARDGSQSTFTADATGYAEFTVEFTPCLQLSGNQLSAMLAVAYHSDDMSSGPQPGPFGKTTHVQLFMGLPKAGG